MTQHQEEYYSNFKCYTKKTRIAIFGRKLGENLQIVEIHCSVKDQFCKLIAKRTYQEFLNKPLEEEGKGNVHGYYGTFHPTVYTIPIKEGDSQRYIFEIWCKNNYFHKFEQDKTYREVVLKKTYENPVILSKKRINKMDKTY